MTQEFLLERKFHFNLRKPKGVKATPIYFVIFVGGKQYKLSTNVKVYPHHWNNAQQIAVVSNTNSRLDNRNNKLVNERLEQIRNYYLEYIEYLCTLEELPINPIELLKTYIYKDMAKSKQVQINVVRAIQEAFNYYYTVISQVKGSTLTQCEKNLKKFIAYVEEKQLVNNVDVFSQVGLNAYKAYLIELMDNGKIGKAHINALCQLIERLINNVLVVNDEYQQYKLTPVKYVKIEDKRQQDEIRRFPLYDDEVQAIKDCTTLTDKEREYRTIFLLQCASGQRISDILQILKGNYEEKDGVITLQTIKKGTYSQIYITDEIRGYLKEVRDIRLINLDKFDDNLYNKALKDICKKANLNRVIQWKDSRGKAHSNMLWEIVVSHDARHTFATNKVKEGVPYETICLMTGHADDRMIKEVYANLTKEDKADKVRNYHRDNNGIPNEPKQEKQVNIFNELFAISELTILKDMQESGVNIYDQPEIKVIYSKLRDIKLLPIAIEQLKDNCPDIDDEISKLIWCICRANYETKAYNIFQYKCLKLGISTATPIPEDELGYIWDEENRDLQENWQLYEYLEKDNKKSNG